jgi:Copper transport outer membrane protein, MctB
LPTASDPGSLAGGLLGPLLLLNPHDNQPQSAPAETSAALAALASGGFVHPAPDLHPAQLAVVITGGTTGAANGAGDGGGAGDRAATMARFAVQLDHVGTGVVLTGRTGSADGTGPVGVVRADTAATSVLSTVDNVETAAGRIATVLALREQADGQSGQYGMAGNAQATAPSPVTD